jgi:hypothetical protein
MSARHPRDWPLVTPQGEYRASYLMLAVGARNPFRSQFLSPIHTNDWMDAAGYFIPDRRKTDEPSGAKEQLSSGFGS